MPKKVCGLDVHAKTIHVCVLDENGNTYHTKAENSPVGITALAKTLKIMNVQTATVESTANLWIPIASALQNAGIEVIIVNPYHAKRADPQKSDKRDAEWLAKLAVSGLLKNYKAPPPKTLLIRTLTRAREVLIRYSPTSSAASPRSCGCST